MSLTKASFSLINGAPLNVQDFGAVGDGVADDTAAFNSVIAYVNSIGTNDRQNVIGATIYCPYRYRITGNLTPITVSGVSFIGASSSQSVILVANTVQNAVFAWNNPGTGFIVGGGLQNIKIEYPNGPFNANCCVADLRYTNGLLFLDVAIERIACFLRLGETGSLIASGTVVSGLIGSVENVSAKVFDMRFGAGLRVIDSQIYVRGVGVPTHPNAMTTAADLVVFWGVTGFWDTCQVTNCLFERFYSLLHLAPPANTVYQNFWFVNTVADYCKSNGVYLLADAAGSAISSINFDATSWVSSWEGAGFYLQRNSGFLDNCKISADVPIAGTQAVYYDVDNATNNKFTNMTVNGCNQTLTVTACYTFVSGSTGFMVQNCSGNNDATIAWARPVYGMSVEADCNFFSVQGCAFYGSTGGYLFAANAAGSANRRVINNTNSLAYAPPVPSSIAPPATTVAITNTTPFTYEYSIFNGTFTDVKVNGVSISDGVRTFTTINPNDTLAITYAAAPTLIRRIMP